MNLIAQLWRDYKARHGTMNITGRTVQRQAFIAGAEAMRAAMHEQGDGVSQAELERQRLEAAGQGELYLVPISDNVNDERGGQ